MAIVQIPPPDEFLQTFRAGFGTDTPDRIGQLQFSLPLYILPVAALREHPESPQLQLAGWQFLTKEAQGKPVLGEVPNRSDANDQLTTSLARGLAIEDASRAYTNVLADADRIEESFALRRLRMSALRIDAFWLKATAADRGGEQNAPSTDTLADGDYVYSFVTFQKNLKFRLVPAIEFLRTARDLSAGYSKRAAVASVP